jgi:signal transduction histidine kinase
MGAHDWLRPPRQVLTIFLAVAAVSAVTLGGLSWYILDQDRELETQRERRRLEQAADRAAAIMQRSLADLQARLGAESTAGGTLPPGVAVVTVTPTSMVVRPRMGLLYAPVSPAAPTIVGTPFAEGERLEFIAQDLAAAQRVYALLAGAGNSAPHRAGALLRFARVARQRGDHARALQAYAELETLGPAVVERFPAALAARLGRMTLFRETGRTQDLNAEASALLADLQQGRWLITKADYEAYSTEARAAAPNAAPDQVEAIARADAVAWLWANRISGEATGRRLLRFDAGAALVLWSSRSSELLAVVAGRPYLTALCGEAFGEDVSWLLSDVDGRPLLGDAQPQPGVVRTAAGLPWTLQVFTPPGQVTRASLARPLLLLVLSLVTLVLAAGWFFIFRSLARERQVAELQSDFVAAVSHEFRSPLTSIGHIAELLAQDRLEPDALRRESYGVLVRDTSRLRDLVEGLLDFGRFDAGTSAFRFEAVDLDTLIRSTVAEFQDRVAADGFRIDLTGTVASVTTRADRDALSRALWNLLDNAVKYSPEIRDIRVEMASGTDDVSIAVRDQGIGIPADEQGRIFDRFVRGAESKRRRIRGTGIGLAMVRQIVLAHGGRISVSSDPGAGSCFTITLPVHADRRAHVSGHLDIADTLAERPRGSE